MKELFGCLGAAAVRLLVCILSAGGQVVNPQRSGFGSGARAWRVVFPLPLARELTITADMPQWPGWCHISLHSVRWAWQVMECAHDLYMSCDTRSYRGCVGRYDKVGLSLANHA